MATTMLIGVTLSIIGGTGVLVCLAVETLGRHGRKGGK